MSAQTNLPLPEEVEGFPSGVKAVIVSARGFLRVVERQYYWNKEKKRGLEKRKYLGYVVDNKYYTNEDYKKEFKRNGVKRLVPQAQQNNGTASVENIGSLDSRTAGEIPVYQAIADEVGLTADLAKTFGEECARAILSAAFHRLNSGANAAYLYESWAEGRFLPFERTMTGKEMTELYCNLARTPGWQKTLFNARIARLPDHEMLSFDATSIATEAAEISYGQYGVGKEGGYQRQLGLVLLVGHESHMPALFRVLPGNITDVTTVPDMLFRFSEITDNRRIFGAVVDRGYFSLANLARFHDTGSRVIVAAKTDSRWIQDAIEESISYLWTNAARIRGQKCWGWTVPAEPSFDDGVKRKLWVHVYRSDSKAHIENTAFYEDLEAFEKEWMNWRPAKNRKDNSTCPLLKSRFMKYFKKGIGVPGKTPLVQDDDAIDTATRYFGIFCNVTTMECTSEEAMRSYKARDLIEKTFKGGKTNLELDVVRAHSDSTMMGRFIVGFVAMTILSRLQWLMKQKTQIALKTVTKEMPPLADEMTFNELKNRLSGIRVIYDGNGNTHWSEVTSRQQMIVNRLGFPDLFKGIPKYR